MKVFRKKASVFILSVKSFVTKPKLIRNFLQAKVSTWQFYHGKKYRRIAMETGEPVATFEKVKNYRFSCTNQLQRYKRNILIVSIVNIMVDKLRIPFLCCWFVGCKHWRWQISQTSPCKYSQLNIQGIIKVNTRRAHKKAIDYNRRQIIPQTVPSLWIWKPKLQKTLPNNVEFKGIWGCRVNLQRRHI